MNVDYTQLSGQNSIDALLLDVPTWNNLPEYRGDKVYYSFGGGGGYSEVSNQALFNSAMRSATRQALNYSSEVTGIEFIETTDSPPASLFFYAGDLSGTSTTGTTYTEWLGDSLDQVTVYLDPYDFPENLDPDPGETGYETLLHEIGHALGLDHPHEGIRLTQALDNTQHSIMSYNSLGSPKSSFQSLDLDALQWIYGGDGIRGDWGIDSRYGPSPTPGDAVAPELVDSAPSAGENRVGLQQTLMLNYSETIILDESAAKPILLELDQGMPLRYELAVIDDQLLIAPLEPLEYSGNYRLTVGPDLVSDSAGNYADSLVLEFSTIANGSAADDILSGSLLDDQLQGLTGDDQFTGRAGNDVLDGGAGIDRALYNDPLSGYTLMRLPNTETGPAWQISNQPGEQDQLISIERLEFSDTGLALDLYGHAGTVAKTLGAVFGAETLDNRSYVRIGLDLLDSGMATSELMQTALAARLGANYDIEDVVILLYQNLTDSNPSLAERAYWIENGPTAAEDLALMAADLELNRDNINLVGLQHTGLEFAL